MNVLTSFVSDGEPSVTVQPCERAFHHPSVLAQLLLTFYTPAGYAALDASLAKTVPASASVIRLVCVHLVRSFARASPLSLWSFDRLNGVYQLLEHLGVVGVSPSEPYRKWDAPSLDHNMALRARFAFIRWRRSGLCAPFFTPLAGIVQLSRLALDQSILSASPRRLSNSWCKERHTPCCCQSCKRRQQVTPLPQPSSCGSISQGMPVRSTKTMPVRAERLDTLGRPPLGLGGSLGNNGSIISHSSPVTNGFLIFHSLPYVLRF